MSRQGVLAERAGFELSVRTVSKCRRSTARGVSRTGAATDRQAATAVRRPGPPWAEQSGKELGEGHNGLEHKAPLPDRHGFR
jgi:hypothetical protein